MNPGASFGPSKVYPVDLLARVADHFGAQDGTRVLIFCGPGEEELARELESLEAHGYDLTRLKVDYHSKFAHPFAPFVMVLLGLPFAFKIGRRGSMYGIGVALLLVLVAHRRVYEVSLVPGSCALALLAIGTVSAFLVRHPARIWWKHRGRSGESPRGAVARTVAAAYAALAAGGLVVAAAIAAGARSSGRSRRDS